MARRFRYFTLLHLDHYHALGIDRHASSEAIEKSYAMLVEEVNRNRFTRFTALLMGQSPPRLARARDVLLSPQQRAAYDKHLDWLYQLHGAPRL